MTNTITGCSTTGVKTITVNPTPTISISPTSASICIGSSRTLTVTGATSYVWSPASSLSSSTGSIVTATPTVSTIYTVTGTTGNCSSTKTISIIVSPQPTLSIIITPTPVCVGNSTTLTATGATTYSWNTGATTSSIVITPTVANTPYTISAYSGACYTYTYGSVMANFYPFLNPIASPSVICAGNSSTLSASSAGSYTWQPGPVFTSTYVVTPISSSIYTVTGGNGGCIRTRTVSVTVVPNPTVGVSASSSSVCLGSSTTLTANGATSYTWSPSTNLSSTTGSVVIASPTVAAIYTVTGQIGNCTNTATVAVGIFPSPSVTVNSPTICVGQSATLTANGASTYSWSTSETTNSVVVTPTTTTSYTVIGTSAAGCSVAVVSLVTVVPAAPFSVSSTASNIYPIVGSAVTVSALVTPAGSYTYSWSPNIGNTASATFTPTDNAVYTLTVANTCTTATTSICINIESTLCNTPSNITLNNASVLNTSITRVNKVITITGTLTITNSTLILSGCTVKMGTNARIIVDPTSKLQILAGSQVFSCESMWYGIEAQNNAVSSATVEITDSRLEDAFNGVVDELPLNIVDNPITVNSSTMNKNYIDVLLQNSRGGLYPLLVKRSTLTSTVSTTSPGNSLKCSSFYTPSVKSRSFAGLYTNSAGTIDFVNDNLGSNFNQVLNKDFGLFFKKTSAKVYEVQFRDMTGITTVTNTPVLPVGVGVYSANSNNLFVSPVTSPINNALLFRNVGYGVITNKTHEVEITDGEFINPAQFSTTTGTVITTIGQQAVYTVDADGLLRVNTNTITSTTNGVTITHSIAVAAPPIFSVSNNTITQGGGNLKGGINVMSSVSTPFTGTTGNEIIAANVITNADKYGIKLQAVTGSFKVSGNDIKLKNTGTSIRDGILLDGFNENVLVDNNDINGQLNPPANPTSYNLNQAGIRCVSSQGCFIQCNKITRVGKGVVYSGNNATSGVSTNTEFFKNILTAPIKIGLELNNGGMIGTQGNATQGASANEWVGFVATNSDQTAVGNGSPASNALNSILYVHNNANELPTDNAVFLPSALGDEYSLANNNIFTTPLSDITTCPVKALTGAKIIVTTTVTAAQRDADYSSYIATVITPTANATPQQKWLLKQQMHKAIRQTTLGSDAIVTAFYNQQQSGDIAKYYEVDSLLSVGDTAMALIKNNTAPINNVIEQTHHDFNNLYLSGIKNASDYDALETIANLCAYRYGNAVYQARALLNIVTFSNKTYQDNCDDKNEDGRMGKFDDDEQGVTLNEFIKVRLYPNPNNGSFAISYDLQKETDIDILVSDISGKLVFKATLDDLNNLQTINLNNVQNGIYFVQLMNRESKLLWTDKVIISK